MSDQRHPGGLSAKEAAKRLRQLGPVEDRTSRSVASIVAGNVFTFFNLIIGVFFVVMLALGLFADALFGFIAVINSYIGIRQEIKAKETLEGLALLVAPRANAVRDGELVELRAEEVVPGDWIRVEPGDQLVADGEVTESRGLTLDESMLTGEADGVRKRVGQRALSGSFCITGSGYYEVDAVREDSYAEKVAGEARTFRHPPSPLQDEVNLVLRASTWAMIPLAVILIFALQARSTPLHEAAQTATAGLITLIPEGLVLLMSVTLAVAAVRLARLDTLVQQMSATEALAAVDTICVDKTGTLTTGELELVSVDVSDPSEASGAQKALARFAASSGERNRTLEAIAENYPASGERVRAEVPFSSEWKWSGLTFGRGETYVLGAPDVLMSRGSLALPVPLQRSLQANTKAGRRVVAFGRASGGLPDNPYSDPPPAVTPIALVVLEETLRPDARETIRYMRDREMDLKLISGDAPQTVTAVASAVGIPAGAGVVTGDQLPEDEASLGPIAEENTIFCRIRPEQKKALVSALADRGRFVAMIGDGVNDVPALKRARMAVGDGIRKPDHQGDRRHRPAQGPVLASASRGRRGTPDRPEHPPPRQALRHQVRLRGRPDPGGGGPGLGLSVPAPAADGGGVPHHRDPVVRAGAGAQRRAPVQGAIAARARRLRGARRAGMRRGLAGELLPGRHGLRRVARGGADRGDHHAWWSSASA